jgi:UrcA family protein
LKIVSLLCCSAIKLFDEAHLQAHSLSQHCNKLLKVFREAAPYTLDVKEPPMLRSLTITALLALGTVAAHAEDVSTQVTYSDLDLSKAADARMLAARLQDAATSVCLKANPENPMPQAMQNCVSTSVHMAMTRIQNDMEDAVHDKLSLVRTAMRD